MKNLNLCPAWKVFGEHYDEACSLVREVAFKEAEDARSALQRIEG